MEYNTATKMGIPAKVLRRFLGKKLRQATKSGDLERVKELNGKLNTLRKPKKSKEPKLKHEQSKGPKLKHKNKKAIFISTPMGGQPKKR